MNLVYLAAIIAVCGAAKLDRIYLPPASAKAAGGTPGDIQASLVRDAFSPGEGGLPKGAFDNDSDGVVVEAAAPGTRASSGESGLGGDRTSYGSTHSKVGGAAFKINQQGYQIPGSQNTDQVESQTLQNFQQGANFDFHTAPPRPQAEYEKASNIVRFQNNVSPQAYNYAFETDNGITAEENGVAVNGIQAEGGFSYTGDDGKLYKVTYTAGEGGYQPSGDHLPTPPPIPDEILKSLEQNAKEAAEGIVDDGSYDAAKYNAEDDHTKSVSDNERYNVGQTAFGNKPQSDGSVSGTFINQNTRVFENLNGLQLPSRLNDDTTRNNIFGSFQSNLEAKPTFGTRLENQPSSTAEPFGQSNNGQAPNNLGVSEPENKYPSNQQDSFSTNDDYSRPIYFGATHFNQETNNRFGIKQTYLPPTHNFNSNNRQSLNSYHSQSTAQSNLGNSNFGSQSPSSNVKVPVASGQTRPQTFASTQINQYSQTSNRPSQSQFINGQFSNKNINTQSEIQTSYNNFNNVHSTLQPSAELTTPFEDFPNTNKQASTDNVSLIPTQASFLDVTGPNSQSNIPNISFGTSSKDRNNNEFKLNVVASQQGFQQLSGTNMKLNGNSQYQGPDNSYYYNLPSKPFNADRVTSPSFVSENSPFNSGANNGGVTKYPRPPTVSSTVASSLSNSMYNQYSNIPQSSPFASLNDRLRPSTNYPQLPVVTNAVPLPTSPTFGGGNKFPEQYSGITQASVSPFPSTSNKYTSSSPNIQQSQNIGLNQDVSQINTFDAFQKETTLTHSFNRDQTNSQVGQQTTNKAKPELGENAPQITPSQQYNGEIYEYNKPAESLSTPTQTDEDSSSTPTNDFSQFGQKLRPSTPTQFALQSAQKVSQTNYNRDAQAQSNLSQIGTKPQLETNLQGQFGQSTQDRPSSPELFNQGFDNRQQTKPSDNLQTIDFKPTIETTKFTSGAFVESQPTIDYKAPFVFSSRIRPCCQGPRTSTEQDLKNEFRKPTPSSGQEQGSPNAGTRVQFGQQNASKKPVTENSFNIPSTGFTGPQIQHSAPAATSQSLPTGVAEVFGGPRRPPSFDEATGYHY